MAKPSQPNGVESAILTLKRHASKSVREGMTRFAIPNHNALGVSVGDIRKVAKGLGQNHELAAGLWAAELYEARMLAAFVEDPRS